jgi:hypothetical protein
LNRMVGVCGLQLTLPTPPTFISRYASEADFALQINKVTASRDDKVRVWASMQCCR